MKSIVRSCRYETELNRRFHFSFAMNAKNFNTKSARRNVAENDINLPIRSSPRPSFHDRITADQIRSSFLTVGARARVSRYFIRVHSATQQFSSYNQNFHRDKSSENVLESQEIWIELMTFVEIFCNNFCNNWIVIRFVVKWYLNFCIIFKSENYEDIV